MKPQRPELAPWQERLLRLNRRQTRALVMGAFAFLWMGLFPPWEQLFVNEFGDPFVRPAGFNWILAPPDLYQTPNYYGATVNWTQLFIQWAVAGGVTLACMWSFRDRLTDDMPPPRLPPRKNY